MTIDAALESLWALTAENTILGPPLHIATASRDLHVLMHASEARLYELLDRLEDQAFIHGTEVMLAKQSSAKMLLVESVRNALHRYDQYHSFDGMTTNRDDSDWTRQPTVDARVEAHRPTWSSARGSL